VKFNREHRSEHRSHMNSLEALRQQHLKERRSNESGIKMRVHAQNPRESRSTGGENDRPKSEIRSNFGGLSSLQTDLELHLRRLERHAEDLRQAAQ